MDAPDPDDGGARSLERFPVHLDGRGAALRQPEFVPEMSWYVAYGERNPEGAAPGRLVSAHAFDSPWTSWERHPAGDELVLVTAGRLTLVQDLPEGLRRIHLGPGEYALNPAGVWHTADADGPASAVFITAGAGTEQRPRDASASG